MTRAELCTEIPEEFVFEAAKHLATTGLPLLRAKVLEDRHELAAWESGDGYQLVDAQWQPPTWREFAARIREDLADVLHQYGEEASDADQPMPRVLADQLLDDADNELAAAFWLLEPHIIGRFVCPNVPNLAQLGVDLGGIERWEGRFPGDNFTAVYATTPLALSCLQYALDGLKAGVRITLATDDPSSEEAGRV